MQKKRQDSQSDLHHTPSHHLTQHQEWRIYLRGSREVQQEPNQALAFQREAIFNRLLCKTTLHIGREYFDSPASSTGNYDALHQMVNDAKAGEFSHLALYSANHLGRGADEALKVAKELIGIGVKIRFAMFPTLQPETTEGFMLFLIQMSANQHEIEILRERTSDGMMAKLLAGGWVSKAPEGYLNKVRVVNSSEHERRVEPNPVQIQAVRLAWVLLLTGTYTLDHICLELSQQGYFRSSGLPWSWTDPKTGKLATAKKALMRLFNQWC